MGLLLATRCVSTKDPIATLTVCLLLETPSLVIILSTVYKTTKELKSSTYETDDFVCRHF